MALGVLSDNDKAREAIRELFADRKHNFKNPPKGKVLNQIINGDTIAVMRKMKANSVHVMPIYSSEL
jgi:hypothetical protein